MDDKSKVLKPGQAMEEDASLRPWTKEDDLTGWEVVADSESHGPMGFIIQVKISPAIAPAVVRAANEAGLDVTSYVQRAVERLACSLGEGEIPASTPARLS